LQRKKQAQDPSVLLPPQRTKRAPGTPVLALMTARVRLTDVGMTTSWGLRVGMTATCRGE